MTDHAGAPRASAPTRSNRFAAALITAGIFLSRIVGLIRERLVAMYFGAGLHADVFSAALRMPNVLQNMLGEGTLSASFIPVYSELLEQGRTREAGRVAGAMFALLLAVAGGISLLGVLFAPWLVTFFTPGFTGQRRELMIVLVRILFPMTGVLVLSAWALGILNSHRKFFVPYFAPVLWNAAIIGALIAFHRRTELDGLLMAAAWGALLGGLLQFGFQLPWVLSLERNISFNRSRTEPAFREAVRTAGPAILGRGVVQVSAYVDMVLASLLAIGAVARMRYAQTLYVLPLSLFAMSVAAAELPELSRNRESAMGVLRERAIAAVSRASFFVVPSLVAFVLLGNVFVAGIYRAGEFAASDVKVVWLTLIAYSVGLLASTSARIYQSAFFALRDTRTPARIAGLRVLTSALAGTALMLQFEPVTIGTMTIGAGLFGNVTVNAIPLGPVGLALGASLGAWLEWALLRSSLVRRVGTVRARDGHLVRTFGAALLAAAAGYCVSLIAKSVHPLPAALLVAAAFGIVYFTTAHLLGLQDARAVTGALSSRLRRA